jgi:hypothetical protein
MKTFIITLLFALSFMLASSQGCLPEGITFSLQSQIDSFQVSYPGCTEIEGDVMIRGSNITDLSGLIVLTSIGGTLEIGDIYAGNPSLTSLAGLEGLTSIEGDLYIAWNYNLTSLSGLDNLNSIGGRVGIGYNYNLTSLMGLENLTSIGDGLVIEEANALTSLTGLEGLISIVGFLEITFSDALTNLTGLDNVEANTISGMYIYMNHSLSACEVRSICDYLASPNGTIEMHDNATGCNSPEEVEAACGVGLDESTVSSRQLVVNIYPNPASITITIEMPTTPDKNTTLAIFNISGKQLLTQRVTQQQTVMDVGTLPGGVYFVSVADDRMVMLQKFIKQ